MNFVVFLFFVLVNQIPVLSLYPAVCKCAVSKWSTLLTVMESQNTASKFSDSSVVELFFDAPLRSTSSISDQVQVAVSFTFIRSNLSKFFPQLAVRERVRP